MSRKELLATSVICCCVFVAAVAGWLLRPYKPDPIEMGRESDFGGPDPHLHVSLINANWAVPEPSRRQLKIELRVRNSAAGDFEINLAKLEVFLDGIKSGNRYQPEEGLAPVKGILNAGDERKIKLTFLLPDSEPGGSIFVRREPGLLSLIPVYEGSFMDVRLRYDLDFKGP